MMSVVSIATVGESPDPMLLVAEAAKKSAVAWVSVAGAPARAVWFVNEGPELLLVIGGAEQELPGLATLAAGAAATTVTLRSKENSAAIVTTEAEVFLLTVDSEEWVAAAKALSPKRLNGVSEDLTAQWRESSQLFRLVPTTVIAAEGAFSAAGPLPDDGSYEELRQSPAGTGRPILFHLGKRTRRRQGK